MKLFICSDIHGDLDSCRRAFELFKSERCDKMLILGDLLYHGPRNDLPKTYAPKAVIALLNENKDVILTVRGNCDTEVDQMVLNFPILADYAYIDLDGLSVFATHGHHHNTETLPPLRQGEILLHGHTHIPVCTQFGNDNYYLNPGSISLPKGGFKQSYMVYENRKFTVKSIDGDLILEKQF